MHDILGSSLSAVRDRNQIRGNGATLFGDPTVTATNPSEQILKKTLGLTKSRRDANFDDFLFSDGFL